MSAADLPTEVLVAGYLAAGHTASEAKSLAEDPSRRMAKAMAGAIAEYMIGREREERRYAVDTVDRDNSYYCERSCPHCCSVHDCAHCNN